MNENKKETDVNIRNQQQENNPEKVQKNNQGEQKGSETPVNNPEKENSEGKGTKMPGRDTRTPVAGEKGESNSGGL